MKKPIYIALICGLFISSCTKTDNSNSFPNTLTILDDGYDLTMKSTSPVSSEDVVTVTMQKTSSSSQLIINAFNTSSHKQYSMNLNAYGSYLGKGLFTQSGTNTPGNQLVEYFQNGQTYSIDSAAVQVDANGYNYIGGTFTMYLSNTNGSKRVTGAFSSYSPIFE